jgi:hypothetical protein
MDMFNLAAGPILLVNPMSPATVFPSAGYFTDDDGERHPIYDPSLNVLAQLQQLNVRDLLHLDEMNVQGSERKIYLYGTLDALSRFRQTGGDIIHLADGTDWLVTQVLEKWDSTTPGQNPHWICVAVTQQIKGAQQLPTQRR